MILMIPVIVIKKMVIGNAIKTIIEIMKLMIPAPKKAQDTDVMIITAQITAVMIIMGKIYSKK